MARRGTRRPLTASVTGAQIAADAERYIGLGYVYGGDASAPGIWDCSSFVSYVLGHDLGLALPGGRWGEPGFPPTAHGPVVVSYSGWTGAVTISNPLPGDLACFVGLGPVGHIGIVVGPNLMVSALNQVAGTTKTPIIGYGPAGAPLIYRRILGLPPGAGVPGPGGMGAIVASTPVGGLPVPWAMLLAAGIAVVMMGAVVAGGALVGAMAVAGAGYATRRLSS